MHPSNICEPKLLVHVGEEVSCPKGIFPVLGELQYSYLWRLLWELYQDGND